MNRNSAFFEQSVTVAKRFLQTAVVIDDRAFYDPHAKPEPPIVELAPPPTPTSIVPLDPSSLSSTGTAVVIERTEETPKDPDPHGIDASLIIESFAQQGIVCSVLRRTEGEDLTSPEDRAHKLFLIADILIVDWQVRHTNGTDSVEETLRFIRAAVSESLRDTPQQLRLIVIYTGAGDLSEVAGQVGVCLEAAAGRPPTKDGEFAFQSDATRVVVLGKPSNKRASDQRAQQVGKDSDLCIRTIEEFAEMTAGLVSNVALDSLAQVRRVTHGLLARFGPQLDAAFLTHRALLKAPSEGDEHLIPLIVAELEAILQHKASHAEPSFEEKIRQWLDTRPNHLPIFDESPQIDTEEKARVAIKEICLTGVHNHENYSIPNQPTWIKKLAKDRSNSPIEKLTRLIAAETSLRAEEKLEILMSLRPRYGDSLPMLTLGTVLQTNGDSQMPCYWLCLQPVCDCFIRDDGPSRAFPFLKIDVVTDMTKKFNIVTDVDGDFVRLRWEPKTYMIKMYEFQANSQIKTVVARLENRRFLFSSGSPVTDFRWIAELKAPHAQRIVQALASESARVGLTESEWQRRYAK